jgi:hypothetical protein
LKPVFLQGFALPHQLSVTFYVCPAWLVLLLSDTCYWVRIRHETG